MEPVHITFQSNERELPTSIEVVNLEGQVCSSFSVFGKPACPVAFIEGVEVSPCKGGASSFGKKQNQAYKGKLRQSRDNVEESTSKDAFMNNLGPRFNNKGVLKTVEERINENDSQQTVMNLLEIPTDVYETIIRYLSVYDVCNLIAAEQKLAPILEQAIKGSFRDKTTFWKLNAKNQVPRQMLDNVIAGYNTVTRRSLARKVTEEQIIDFDAMKTVTWHDIVSISCGLSDVINCATVVVDDISTFVKRLKNEIKLAGPCNTLVKFKSTTWYSFSKPEWKVLIGVGPYIFFYIRSNNLKFKHDIAVYNADSLRCVNQMNLESTPNSNLRDEIICGSRFCYHKSFVLRNHCGEPNCFKQDVFLANKIVVLVFPDAVYFLDIIEGGSEQFYIPHELNGIYSGVQPITAINSPFVFIWKFQHLAILYLNIHCDVLHSYPLRFDNPVLGIEEFWKSLVMYRAAFIPVLINEEESTIWNKVDNDIGKKLVYPFSFYDKFEVLLRTRPTRCKNHVYMISPLYGVYSLNEFYSKKGHAHVITRRYPRVMKRENIEQLIRLLEVPHSSCQGHGLYMFWNNATLAISWDMITWHYLLWTEVIGAVVSDASHGFILSHELIVAALDGDVFFLKIVRKKLSDDVVVAFEFELIRHLKLDLIEKEFKILDMSFDINKGVPYLILHLRSIKKEDVNSFLSFQLLKIRFEL